ncbi:MAG: protein kinase [Planctomycetota bacterium]
MAVTVQQVIDVAVDSELATVAQIRRIHERIPEDQRTEPKLLAKALREAGVFTAFQESNILAGRARAMRVGEYTILDRIGQGGMGEVFKAVHRRMGRVVAVKFVAAAASKKPEVLERFQREVRATAKLNHPHIVTSYDAGEDQNRLYLVMEFVRGRDLGAVLAGGKSTSVKNAIAWTRQAAEGLQYAHEQGVIHRDIKPANLLINKQHHIKILDMGLARNLAPNRAASKEPTDMTATGVVMGTADYMAPEQASDPKNVDQRVDVYALGCTLFRLISGRVPYEADTFVHAVLAHQTNPIPSLAQVKRGVPPALDHLFRRMVAKRPEDRIASMREVIDALNTVEKSRQTVPKHDGLAPTLAHDASAAAGAVEVIVNDATDTDDPTNLDDPLRATLTSAPQANLTQPMVAHSVNAKPAVAGLGPAERPKRRRIDGAAATATHRSVWWIVGTIGGTSAMLLIGALGMIAYRLANRKPETVVVQQPTTVVIEREAAPVEEVETKLPPLPDPFGDHAAAEWVLAIGGRVKVLEPSRDSYAVWHPAGLPASNFRVEAIDVAGLPAVTDTSISRIRALTALRELSVAETAITDDALEYLRDLATLRSMNLRGCEISDEGMKRLGGRSELVTLLADGRLTDEGIESLHALAKLKSISLQSALPTRRGLESLCKFSPNLSTLQTDGFQLVDSDLEFLTSLSQLRTLGLINAPITDGAVVPLSKLKTLRYLIIQGTKIPVNGVRRLQTALPDCKIYGGTYSPRRNAVRNILMAGGSVHYSADGNASRLLKDFNALPDEFLVDVVDLTDVKSLELGQMSLEETSELILTDSGVGLGDLRQLSSHFPLLNELYADGTDLNNGVLAEFSPLRNLQFIEATRTSVTESGAEALKKALPTCEIRLGKSQQTLDREIVEWIAEIGGFATVQLASGARLTVREPADLPDHRFRLVGVGSNDNENIVDEQILRLRQARNLRSAVFLWPRLTDEGVQVFKDLPKLEYVDLGMPRNRDTLPTDRGLLALRQLKDLTRLNVMNWRVSARGLRAFGRNENIVQVAFGGGHPEPKTCNDDLLITAIELFPNVENFSAITAGFTDAGMSDITNWINLERFHLGGSSIGDAGVKSLVQCKKLVRATIARPKGEHGNETVARFEALDDLKILGLQGWRIDDGCVDVLTKYSDLTELDIRDTQISPRGGLALSEALPNTKILFDDRSSWITYSLNRGAKLSIETPGPSRKLEIIEQIEELPERFLVRKVDFSGRDFGSLWHLPIAIGKPNVETREWDLSGCGRFDRAQLNVIPRLQALEILNLAGTIVTDDDLKHIAKSPSLRQLNLKGTQCTREGVQMLSKAIPRCRIEWSGGMIRPRLR